MPSFPKPDDVPDYVAVPAVYKASPITSHTIGDGSNARGGTPPYFANQLTDPNPIDLDIVTGWLRPRTGEFKSQAEGGTEGKFRTHANFSGVVLRDDPVRNYGQPGTSHWHTFVGVRNINAWSTYNSLRNHPASNAAGGPANATGYWAPSVLVPLGGKVYAKVPDYAVIYYTVSPIGQSNLITKLPRGLRYVTGTNMDDHHNTQHAAEVAAAGDSLYSGVGNGFGGWKNIKPDGSYYDVLPAHRSNPNDPIFAKYLKALDGSDPWGGLATSGQLVAGVDAPMWWDGRNPWSPGGYNHFRHNVSVSGFGSAGAFIGPDHYFRMPSLEITWYFSHEGFADYGNWRLSSDDHLSAANPAHEAMPNGWSWHVDWLGAWDAIVFDLWQTNGPGAGGGVPHTMGTSTISADRELLVYGTAPDGRSPQINLSQRLLTRAANMVLLPNMGVDAGRGPFTIRSRGS